MGEKDRAVLTNQGLEQGLETMSGEQEGPYNNDLFPPEILEKIFRNMYFSDLAVCMQVCRKWNSVANYVKEEVCRNECAVKFNSVYKDAYRRGRLSWVSLLRSLRLWSEVSPGNPIQVYLVVLLRHVHIAKKNPHMLQFLSDGVLSYPRMAIDHPRRGQSVYTVGDCNSITYLDAHSMRVLNCIQFNFIFNMYEETDEFIVFREKNLNIRVFTKVDGMVHTLGKVCSGLIYRGASRFFVVEHRIFFITDDHVVWMVTYSTLEGRGILTKQPLLLNWDSNNRQIEILAVCCPDSNTVKVLTSSGIVVTITQDRELNLIHTAYTSLSGSLQREQTACTGMDVANLLQEHGFNWWAPHVYAWLAPFDAARRWSREFCMVNNAVVHVYDKIVIVGTKRDALAIYYNPYRNGKLCLYDVQPTVQVTMNQVNRDASLLTTSSEQRQVLQIGVIEMETCHRLYLFYAKKILVLDVSDGNTKGKEKGRYGRLSCSHAKVIRLNM